MDIKGLPSPFPFDVQVRLSIDHLPLGDIERMRAAGALVADPARQRPRYFDGRFLAARDLERDQAYFLTRQSELARVAGAGVVTGLMVTAAGDFRVDLEPGVALTPAGELIVLIPPQGQQALTIELANLATIQELDAAFGLLDSPREPARNRSGLFILALRPVEYTANPIGSYPTSIDERRKPMDGEVIEATAVILVPIQDPGFEARPAQQRSLAARRIFLESSAAQADEHVVPIAVLQLANGGVRWVDPYLVRREVGAEHASVGPFGASPRALREAFFQQYQQQLADVLAARAGSSLRFAAAEVFRVLPPAGPLPAAAVDLAANLQFWFPPGVQVAHVTIPEDELTALLEESLLLPPIDLQAPAAELARVAVLIVSPVARSTLEGTSGEGQTQILSSPVPVALPAANNILRLLANGGFQNLRLPLSGVTADTTTPVGSTSPPPLRWYVRRRLRHIHPDAAVIAASSP